MYREEDKWNGTDAENEFIGMLVKIVGWVGASYTQ